MAQQLLVNGETYGSHRNKVNANETELYAAVASAQAVANAAIPATQKGVASGVASLDGTGKVPSAQLPTTAAPTLSSLSDVASFDLGTTNTSVAAIKSTANAAIPASQKGAASGVASLGSDSKVPTAQMTGKLALSDLSDGATQAAAIASKQSIPTAWAASSGGGTPALSSGTATVGSAYINTTAGYTALSPSIDGIAGVNQNDVLECFTAGTWTLVPANNILPPRTLGATYTLVSSDNGVVFNTPVTCTVTVPTGLGAGFGCGFMGAGAVTFSGAATVTDNRKTGSTVPFAGLICSAADTYQARGEKA